MTAGPPLSFYVALILNRLRITAQLQTYKEQDEEAGPDGRCGRASEQRPAENSTDIDDELSNGRTTEVVKGFKDDLR